jgi:hypothetical protein
MHRMRFEPKTTVLQRTKTSGALYRTAAVTGMKVYMDKISISNSFKALKSLYNLLARQANIMNRYIHYFGSEQTR